MKAFAELLDRMVLTPQRNGKLRILADYFARTPDPDRGYALGALTETLKISHVKPALIRELVMERMDETLFRYSYDYVGDLAETVSLVWEEPSGTEKVDQSLAGVVEELNSMGRADARSHVRDLLDRLDVQGRYAFIKLAMGGLRIGLSARLAKQALADMGGVDISEIETLWHGLHPPYVELFAWLEGRADMPVLATPAIFHSVMLAHPISEGDLSRLDPADFSAEWKWDGIRVQLSASGARRKLYSRSGDDISESFPDILAAVDFEGVVDGELLVGGTARTNSPTSTFSDLQQRLNRKSVSQKQMRDYPAFLRAYDILFDKDFDIREARLDERRARLETLIDKAAHDRFDLSPLVPFDTFEQLDRMRSSPPDPVIEGVMIKRRDSSYRSGRIKGAWFKWKRDPHTVDAVMMYAQRGHGKRSSYYSDFTFGVWTGEPGAEFLVPVGKAYFGFTDEELEVLDKFVRNNTVERFGPVRAVRADPDHGFVLEVAFEGIARSNRHKSGVAMRFPRISRLRHDKLPIDADRLDVLIAMIDGRKTGADEMAEGREIGR
jgi:DNA ligase 1